MRTRSSRRIQPGFKILCSVLITHPTGTFPLTSEDGDVCGSLSPKGRVRWNGTISVHSTVSLGKLLEQLPAAADHTELQQEPLRVWRCAAETGRRVSRGPQGQGPGTPATRGRRGSACRHGVLGRSPAQSRPHWSSDPGIPDPETDRTRVCRCVQMSRMRTFPGAPFRLVNSATNSMSTSG